MKQVQAAGVDQIAQVEQAAGEVEQAIARLAETGQQMAALAAELKREG